MVPVHANGLPQSAKFFADEKDLHEALQSWLLWDRNPTTKNMIIDLANRRNKEELRKLLLKRLQFGTAGLRGRMGPGTAQMNELVIIQTSQGLASYVKKTCENGKKHSVVIGYDGRHNSKNFSELTALAFLNMGFKVYLSSRVCPTPFVPFAVKHLKLNVGVMITASHNPKEDNGYKVYWGNGAQIIPPHDKGIQKEIMENLEPASSAWSWQRIKDPSADIEDPLPLIEPVYFNILANDTSLMAKTRKSMPLKFTYTAMHGVGYRSVVQALKSSGVQMEQLLVVTEQRDPDPEFSTVKFPNPEEGKSALTLAMKLADSGSSPIILANDPDADRLAVAEKLGNGEWKIFNGNELGALLGWWALQCYREKPDAERLPLSDCYMIASTVSSKFLKTMAETDGFHFLETLTGFKWMGNRAVELAKEGKEVLFAFEEAIGFMIGTAVLDKDGVSALVHVAQLATILYAEGITLNDKLTSLYESYGHHVSHNSYYICHDPVTINKVFENIRNFTEKNGCNGYPNGLMGNKYKVVSVRDLTTGYDSDEPDQKAKLPISKSSHMITFKFDNGLVLTLRTSGTEPKIKYYSELRAAPGHGDRCSLQKLLDDIIGAMIQEWLLPEKWGLTPRSD